MKMIGNDMKLDPGVGTCGNTAKAPVGVGQPTLMVENLTIGGTATNGRSQAAAAVPSISLVQASSRPIGNF